MSKKRQPLYKDLLVSLDEVERWWIRIPVTLILCLPVLVIGLVINICHGFYCGLRDWYDVFLIECLKGKPKE